MLDFLASILFLTAIKIMLDNMDHYAETCGVHVSSSAAVFAKEEKNIHFFFLWSLTIDMMSMSLTTFSEIHNRLLFYNRTE